MAASRRLSSQHTGLGLAEGLEDALDVVLRQVGMDWSHVDPVEGSWLLSQLVNDGLSLANVTGPANLQDPTGGKTRRAEDSRTRQVPADNILFETGSLAWLEGHLF